MPVIKSAGIQIPPMIQTVRVINNLLYTSWNYVRIPTVDVTLHWSLSFFRPSQLSNMTTTLLNTNTYNNTLQGARSCDPFRLCIKAENVVGNSSWSCVNNTLPFLPSVENIHYALSRFNDYFTLTVTILVRNPFIPKLNNIKSLFRCLVIASLSMDLL